MSTPKRNAARVIAVDPPLTAILRLQTLAVLEANHQPFEDVRELDPPALLALSDIFRDAFAVLDALGWIEPDEPTAVDVPMTDGHAAQLRRCQADLQHTNRDRRIALAATINIDERRAIQADIDADHAAAIGLERVLTAHSRAATR
jgi:hypothetical protein